MDEYIIISLYAKLEDYWERRLLSKKYKDIKIYYTSYRYKIENIALCKI